MAGYDVPVGIANAERPKCWGQSFNSEDRECKGCPWQASCRDQVIRLSVNRQPNPPQQVQAPTPMNYYQPFQPQPIPQYAAPAPVPAPMAFQPPKPAPQYSVTQYRPPAPIPLQIPVQAPHMMPYQQPMQQAPVLDWYGRFQDPLHYVSSTTPSPYRPQMHGETFFERAVKNAALAVLEAIMLQALLAIRQMILPPGVGNIIDINPDKKGM